jgi:protein-S-isoprenylcysteine O-methyltransferase Ste14
MIPCAATRLSCLSESGGAALCPRRLGRYLLVRPEKKSGQGVALWVNGLGLLITLVPAVALMSLVVIPREERYLETRFPSEYASYKTSVRRWL